MSRESVPEQADVLPDSEVSNVLAVMAHPDDVDFSAAGSIAGWTEAGISVTYAICTDGQAGGFDLDVPRSELPRIRRDEQRAAAHAVGVEDVRFLGHVDGELRITTDLVRELVRLIREVRPQRMVISSPERNWRILHASHPDHLASGEAAMQAMYPAAQNPFAFPELLAEGLEPWTVGEVWLAAHTSNNHAVDVTDTFERKLTALHAHVSQHPEPDKLRDRLTEWLGEAARRHGLPEGRLAETFAVYPVG